MTILEEYIEVLETEEARLIEAILEDCDKRIRRRDDEITRSRITDNSLKYACSLIANKGETP